MIFGRSAEFVISLVLIGQLVTARFSARAILGALFMTLVLIVVGTWLTPDASEPKGDIP